MTGNRVATEVDVVTKLSRQPVADTVAKLTAMESAEGMQLFVVIDQAAEARRVGLALRETTLVIFGSPTAGTPVMAASPLAALDLPLKVLIWRRRADQGLLLRTRRPRGQPPPHRGPGRQPGWN